MDELDHELMEAIWPAGTVIPTRVMACRRCEQKNRIEVATAVLRPASIRCGACRQPLFLSSGEPLVGLSSSAYEHSLDHKTLALLKAVPGFPALVRWFVATFGERSFRLLQMSDSVRCGPDQFPELVQLLERARQNLGMGKTASLFLSESRASNAVAMSAEEAVIVVWSGLLDNLEDGEVMSVLAHELGHIHADHVVLKIMAQLIIHGALALGGAVKLLTWPLQRALLVWNRCSELTADRAALLGCRSVGGALRVHLKLAGGGRQGIAGRTRLKVAPFIRQARDLALLESSSSLDNALSAILTMDRTHPFPVWRLMHLLDWIEHGNYLDIMAGRYVRTSD